MVWKQQTFQNYYKSLDPIGSAGKTTVDRRQFQPKTLQQDIRIKHEEQRKRMQERAKISDPQMYPSHLRVSDPRMMWYQYVIPLSTDQVLKDTVRLVLLQLEHRNSAIEDSHLVGRVCEFLSAFLGMDLSSDLLEPTSSSSSPPDGAPPTRARGSRKTKRLLTSVLDKDKDNTSALGSQGSTPTTSVAEEDESTSNPANGPEVLEVESSPSPWVTVDDNVVVGGRRFDSTTSHSRSTYYLYCNTTLYCFMRLFSMLYERLNMLYEAEGQVKALVEMQKIPKPAHELGLIDEDRRPEAYFEDTSPSASYYHQLLRKLEVMIKGTDGLTQPYLEDLLRRYWVHCGWRSYHIDKLLLQMERLGIMMGIEYLQHDGTI